uniref:Uncharacterized protein n=1 Tax=Leersia perrieri TaxID=77586 RepID=A0A0D9XJB9_9ORYZ
MCQCIKYLGPVGQIVSSRAESVDLSIMSVPYRIAASYLCQIHCHHILKKYIPNYQNNRVQRLALYHIYMNLPLMILSCHTFKIMGLRSTLSL